MARVKGRMTGLVAKYQISYYHMITVAVNEKLGILEVIEGEEDSLRLRLPAAPSQKYQTEEVRVEVRS